ncbi:MAG: flavodoxin-dependent (E)-4-hydroxy-3-methylbut-2-enyl-diphosphate synthase [Candidatus Omnitrophica bacterium]|nr:flavodoxin-dependent (E)-4-hydroxy-3-methylbut-2-enyl-diphosphate synthase [Candidatus Omnitrophota bacterium]
MITRRKTRLIRVGGVKVGAGAAVSIQSMTKVETSNVSAVVSQIKRLKNAGCEIIRVAVKTQVDARAIKDIKKKIDIPLVADIHFDYRLALESIKSGADKIRLNPGNLKNRGEVEQVAKAAGKAGIPIRIGINSGSIFTNDERRLSAEAKKAKAEMTNDARIDTFVKSAMRYVKHFEELGFHDIIISLKGSNVSETVEAYKKISGLCDYPLHLGVTASGPYDTGIVKSSIGIGALLLDGIGDTIRVSLTADPVEEVVAAKRILSSLGLRRFGPEIISCPTCGRCQVDLQHIVEELDNKLSTINYELSTKAPITVAVMGCEVNGPGEAREADIGIAFGRGSGMLFKKGKVVKKVTAKDAVKELLAVIASPATI